MTAVTLYQSTDASAPSLTGQAGSLAALLDAVLVNGYGAKAALGWAATYNSGNKRVYQAGAGSGSTQPYLWVDDGGAGSGSGAEARVRGFLAMTSLPDTGTDPFPTVAQMTTGYGTIRKSLTTDSTARAWIAIGTHNMLYLFVNTMDTSDYRKGFFFGDIIPYKPGGDAFSAAIVLRDIEGSGASANDWLSKCNGTYSYGTQAGCFLVRPYTGSGSAVLFAKISDSAKTGNTSTQTVGSAGLAYPNGVDLGLYLAPFEITSPVTAVYSIRGKMPGLWNICHNKPFAHGDTVSGTGALTGRTFMVVNVDNGGQLAIETSNTWLS